MLNEIINALEDLEEMHEQYMISSHSMSLQGMKRFNRYEKTVFI